ncbi:MAG TPA: hypothetical protein VHS03_16590 [Gaiellaceae bacterium]|nr:hypothetical protein [Gaiellaceae bacterium]
MRIPRLKVSLAVALVVAGVAAAVAIGAPTRAAGLTPNQQAVMQAFDKTSKLPSLRFAFVLGLSGGVTGKNGYTLTGSGGADLVHQSSAFTLNLGALASLLGGATGGATIPSSVPVVVTGGVAYVHAPSVATQIQAGAEWIKFTSAAIPSSVSSLVNPKALSSVTPQKVIAATSVHRVGKASVRGTSTTHYTVTVAVAKLPAGLSKAGKTVGVSSAQLQVYVDGAGYVRRVSSTLAHVKFQKGAAGSSLRFQVDLFDFGAPVTVTKPPASKTVSGDALVKQLLGGAGG